jgi:hypothetical protein
MSEQFSQMKVEKCDMAMMKISRPSVEDEPGFDEEKSGNLSGINGSHQESNHQV